MLWAASGRSAPDQVKADIDDLRQTGLLCQALQQRAGGGLAQGIAVDPNSGQGRLGTGTTDPISIRRAPGA